jgi:Fe-S cluster assembly protein SufD
VESSAALSRLHALRSFDPADFPVPNGREEEWRFTPMRRLRGLHGDAAVPVGKVAVDVDVAPNAAAETAKRGRVRDDADAMPVDRVSARAWASFADATVVTVAPNSDADQPTVIAVRGEDAQGVAFGHTVIDVGANARATVVLDHTGAATLADNLVVNVGDGASLSLVSVQEWDAESVHLSRHYINLARDARVQHASVSLGGGVVRLGPSVSYGGPGGDAELLGLYFADSGQHLEHRLFVDHNQPHCRSRVDYKGALQGDTAHTVWIGDVLIRPEAVGTDTYERNRNLLLTEGARADSVPNLEILTGEVVGAGHASASGRLEDHHLFYLMARGIPMEEARRLVIRGFFGELIGRIGGSGAVGGAVADLRERISAAVEGELAGAPA